MLGSLYTEDYLNYRLIMEGFYYDAAIEHIIEIMKNSLYFAVISGENRLLKTTHETCYFSIDDELLYVNYYYDFGPLNISCLFKYCSKLNSYLQYTQGLKRIVHYTTANPIRRVNAAFLIGSYAIIHLKMQPKEIYHMLLSSGGPFKPYIDASQGTSQYTIGLLDCFNAIQKALIYNFFNFHDFNISDYDTHDKLQNGDMNWLLPRKFLAFIGPTDNELTNGHAPEFYVRYFLDNDIKTVIRLNNKLYDAANFSKVGIEHHELFFPDGSVPPKQILLRFLEICENARAAIAVHCKAGLGRTGSLIGAYIIKHYRLTAREAIAWMRICRPGSVIGQQQSWLEKIESWLWRQGTTYRLQHFGDGEKIPRLPYGIYSLRWPREREKILKQVQRKKLVSQHTCSRVRSGVENSTRLETVQLIKNPVRSAVTPKKTSFKSSNYQKPTVAGDKNDDNRKMSNNAQNRNCENCLPEVKEIYKMHERSSFNPQYREEIQKSKRTTNAARYKENSEFVEENQKRRYSDINSKRYANPNPTTYEYCDPEGRTKLEFNDDFREVKTVKPKRHDQSPSREQAAQINMHNRICRHMIEDLGQTQGDKLNEIKAQRYASGVDTEDNGNKAKPRRQLTNVTNVNMYHKSRPTASKKQEMETETETILPIKRSQFEQRLYSSKV